MVYKKMPYKVDYENAANTRWLNKKVLKSKLLDDMENLKFWSHRGEGKIKLISERSIDGNHSLRLTSPTKTDKQPFAKGRPFGNAIVTRVFSGENWTDYNRISFWVYPNIPGFHLVDLRIRLVNEGSKKIPDIYDREGLHNIILKPNKWNHVVWEFPNLARDMVTSLDIFYTLQGQEPGSAKNIFFDIDHLELQQVNPDYYEGWSVAPGRISYSHTGYSTGSSKTAIANGIKTDEFQLISMETGQVELKKKIKIVKGYLDEFQVMDFSEFNSIGRYIIKAGDIITSPFKIDDDIWEDTIWKTINFFYSERCGTAIPGIHENCHRDWKCKYNGKDIIINGGWHDAGDLSQGLVNTGEATYSMYKLVEKIKKSKPVLSNRLKEEARWGLEWILKTRFGNGYRCTWATIDFWTDGILGTDDDIIVDAQNKPFENFIASLAEAVASNILQEEEPIISSYCLKAAKEDFGFAIDKFDNNIELAGAAALAALEIYKVTGDSKYAKKAIELGNIIVSCQQQFYPDWDKPIIGFFYETPKKDNILHYFHRGHEQGPVVALVELCNNFPDNEKWIDWYTAVLLYSEYMKTIAEYTKPYYMLPSSIYKADANDSEKYATKNKSFRTNYLPQVLEGIKLSEDYYLRLFPVWYDFRGNSGTILSQTKGLSTIAHLRNDLELAKLCELQLQWHVGRNPFSQSLMYGEGYDFPSYYSALCGNIVGALPVGIETKENKDVPYWPVQNLYTYKEIWVHPSSRWLWIMSDMVGSSLIQGHTNSVDHKIKFTELKTGKHKIIYSNKDNSFFSIKLVPGKYKINYNNREKSINVLPAKDYYFDLKKLNDFVVACEEKDNNIILKAISDYAIDELSVKVFNLKIKGPFKKNNSDRRKEIEWSGTIVDNNKPWVAIITDSNKDRKEVYRI